MSLTKIKLILIPCMLLILYLAASGGRKAYKKESKNYRLAIEDLEKSFPKVKESHASVMDNIISKYGRSYDEINMGRTNKGLDTYVSGVNGGQGYVPIKPYSSYNLPYLSSFFYSQADSDIVYNLRKSYNSSYMFVYYFNKKNIPNKCLECDDILSGSTFVYNGSFCCIYEENWVIHHRKVD